MNNDIVTTYIDHKFIIIEKYIDILLKYSLKKTIKLNKTINLILEEYRNYYLSSSKDSIPEIFNISKEEQKELHDILLAIINCYQKQRIEYDSIGMINKMLFLARVINMALILERETRLPSENLNYMAIINRIIVNPLITTNKRLELSSELENVIKKEIALEKKFWKLQEQDSFILELKRINTNQFFVNGNYQLKLLNRYTNRDIELVANQKDISETLISIYIEQLQTLVLKSLLLGYHYTFYIQVTMDYLNKKKNITNLNSIINNNFIKKRLVLVLSFDEFTMNDNITELQNLGFIFALNNLNSDRLYDMSSLGNIKIVMAPKDFLRNNRIYLDEWRNKGVRFIDPTKIVKIELEEIFKGD